MRRHLLNGLIAVFIAAGALILMAGSEDRATPSAPAKAAASTNPVSNIASTNTAASTNGAQTWKVMEEYFAALAKNKIPEANQLGQQTMTRATNDANALNFLSWRIFADRGIRHRDRALALAAAERAFQLTGAKDPVILDTYAKALWENGRHAEAIEHQKKAVELCTVEAKRIDMEANLNRYIRLSKEAKK